jgi:hypothetical protein
MARNKANRGKGKAIKPIFGTVQHNGSTYSAVQVAASKKRAISTALWAVLPGQGNGAPAFVAVATMAGCSPMQQALTLANAQLAYAAHGQRAAQGSGVLSQFGLVPAAPSAPAAPAPAAKPAS